MSCALDGGVVIVGDVANDGSLIVGFGVFGVEEVGLVEVVEGGFVVLLVEAVHAAVEVALGFGFAGAEPDGPHGVFGEVGDLLVVVAEGFGEAAELCFGADEAE